MANRVCVIADGFNLYHSLKDAEEAHANGLRLAAKLSTTPTVVAPPLRLRWFNLYGLCTSLLSSIGGAASLRSVSYFSALAHHCGPEGVERHRAYLAALTLTGVDVQLARFKRKDIKCPLCKGKFLRYEEKETDVAVAVKLLELSLTSACETILLITGDTDLLPAIRSVRRLAPAVKVFVALPFGRDSYDLRNEAHRAIKLTIKHYQKWQLPPTMQLPNGDIIEKPAKY